MGALLENNNQVIVYQIEKNAKFYLEAKIVKYENSKYTAVGELQNVAESTKAFSRSAVASSGSNFVIVWSKFISTVNSNDTYASYFQKFQYNTTTNNITNSSAVKLDVDGADPHNNLIQCNPAVKY